MAPSFPPNTAAAAQRRLQAAMAPLVAPFSAAGAAAPNDRELLAALGKVIGLADSIQLHGALARRQPAAVSGADSAGKATELVLAGRAGLLELIADSLRPNNAGAPLGFPDLAAPAGFDGLTGPQRLQRFYARLQQELAVQVQTLRQRVQRHLKTISPVLARLAELDLQVGQLVTSRLEEAFAVIPRLLPRYCESVASADAGQRHPDWQTHIMSLTRDLLLAELDVRLQPVVGLAEAIEEMNGAQTQ